MCNASVDDGEITSHNGMMVGTTERTRITGFNLTQYLTVTDIITFHLYK